MGLGRAYRLGGDFKVIIWEASHKGMGPFLWVELTPQDNKQSISCNYSCTISFLVKLLLVKLKYLYIQYASISIMKKQNSNQNVTVEKMVVFVKTFGHYHHKFNFGNFFSCHVKLLKNLKLKFRLRFNHGFTDHGCMHSAV